MERIHFSTWGKNAPWGGYAIRKDGETQVQAVCRSLERRSGWIVCAGPRNEGTALTNGTPTANHYAVTLGSPVRTGSYTPRSEVWFSIPMLNH